MVFMKNASSASDECKKSVLVVEDNDELREFLVTFLSMEYTVYSAENGHTGIQLALKNLPDVIISDIVMPAVNGFELVSQLSKTQKTCHIPIILITAKVDHESQLKGLSFGAVDYITKPFDIKNISFKLKNILLRQTKLLLSHSCRENQQIEEVTIKESDKNFLKKLENIMATHYQDSYFTVAKLVTHINVTERQLQRKFKRLFQEKPATYIRNYRLQKAKKLLLKGDSIAIISEDVGFNSQSYFSQSFKLTFGQSPKDYILENSSSQKKTL